MIVESRGKYFSVGELTVVEGSEDGSEAEAGESFLPPSSSKETKVVGIFFFFLGFLGAWEWDLAEATAMSREEEEERCEVRRWGCG